jgi:predicted small integral membrane protein
VPDWLVLDWMVWTAPTAAVFAGLGVLLVAMIGLISAAVVLVAWIAVTDASMWLALAVAVAAVLVIGRWG